MSDDSNPFSVRKADPYDLDALFDIALFLAHEDALQPVSETKLRAAVQRCVNMDNAIAGIIDGKDGIDGTVGLVIQQFPYSDADHLATLWIGTSQAYRDRITKQRQRNYAPEDAGLATRLLRFAKWASEQMDVPLVISVLTARDLAAKLTSYQRQTPQIGALFGWGDLPDRSFFNQSTPGGWKRTEGSSPRGEPASGQVRQSYSGRTVEPARAGQASRAVAAVG
jgi:hypothetical protein